MTREWTMKSFKSGNSTALRVPASVGIMAGEEWRLVEGTDKDSFRLERVSRPKRKFNIEKVWGSATSLRLIDPDDRWFEERSLDFGAESSGKA